MGTLIWTHWAPVALYVGLITYLSAQQNLQPPIQFFEADKLYHLGEYAVLGLLLARAWNATRSFARPLSLGLVALACGIVIGATDEYHQSFVPGRDSSVYDLMADTAGLTIAQFVYRAFTRG